jgi:hypothetical protein
LFYKTELSAKAAESSKLEANQQLSANELEGHVLLKGVRNFQPNGRTFSKRTYRSSAGVLMRVSAGMLMRVSWPARFIVCFRQAGALYLDLNIYSSKITATCRPFP